MTKITAATLLGYCKVAEAELAELEGQCVGGTLDEGIRVACQKQHVEQLYKAHAELVEIERSSLLVAA